MLWHCLHDGLVVWWLVVAVVSASFASQTGVGVGVGCRSVVEDRRLKMGEWVMIR